MRIAFIHDWEVVPEQEITWKDGLAAAMRILSQRHQVKMFVCGPERTTLRHEYFDINVSPSGQLLFTDVQDFEPDVILHWADLTRPNAIPLSALGIPQALCFAGGNTAGETLPAFDHVMVESNSYLERFAAAGVSVSYAFGTNTALFKPTGQKKIFDICFPATYCDWKRHKLLATTVSVGGFSCITAGWQYPVREADCWQVMQGVGGFVLPHIGPEALVAVYNASKVCVVPSRSDGGSQRTVLEAMACGLPVVTCEDSEKTSEFVRRAGYPQFAVPPEAVCLQDATFEALYNREEIGQKNRQFVLDNFSEDIYARQIEEGLQKAIANHG